MKFVAKSLVIVGLLFLLCPNIKIKAQTLPQLGAEIFIEPGQTKQEIDEWVKSLKQAGMPVARVFMLWNYIEIRPGTWDFSLYDDLFDAAKQYGVKITVTLVPNQPPFFRGESFFYYTHNMKMYTKTEYRSASMEYIRRVVDRYKNSPALDSWWLYNEPNGYPQATTFAVASFQEWLKSKYHSIDSLNKKWHSFFASFQEVSYDKRWMETSSWIWQAAFYDWNEFWAEFINQQILWLKTEVRKYDTTHLFTTNPPGVFTSLAHYDLSGMAKHLDILGASLHPSWNFSWVPEDRFGLAVSWQNDLLYGVTEGRKPYWISELQGGSNWEGSHPLDPSPNDIARWTWTSIGSGADRVIYWLLNSRMQGQESNEWSLFDFQNHRSDRMEKAAEIAEIIDKNEEDFAEAKPLYTPVTIIVSPLTLLMQERKYSTSGNSVAAVNPLAHQKAAMAIYNSLMEQGIPVQLQLITSFNWDTSKRGLITILPDIMALTTQEVSKIKDFVSNGNKLIVTGMTGVYDENEKSWLVNRSFPLEHLFGGTIKDILSDSVRFIIKLDTPAESLPSQLIYSQISPTGGSVLGEYNKAPIALSNNYGKGSVLWIPSMIGVGGWEYGDNALSDFLINVIKDNIKSIPIRFSTYERDCYMHTLKNKNGYLSFIFNNNKQEKKVQIVCPNMKSSQLLYGTGWDVTRHLVTLQPGATVVIHWK